MRNLASADLAADTREPDVCRVVLTAGVEAAACLHAEVLHRGVELVFDESEPLAELAGDATRRRDAELAGVGARAGGHVGDGAGAGFGEIEGGEALVERRCVGAAQPAEREVLLDGATNRITGVFACEVGKGATLRRREVAERHLADGGEVAVLSLGAKVVLGPLVEIGGGAAWKGARLPNGLLVRRVEVFQEVGPTWVGAKAFPLFGDEALELVDADLLDEELDACACATLLLAEASEDAGDGLRER